MRQLLLCPPEPLQNGLVVKSHTVQVNVDFLPIAPGHGLCPTPGAAVVESGVVEPYGSWAQWIHLYPHTTYGTWLIMLSPGLSLLICKMVPAN